MKKSPSDKGPSESSHVSSSVLLFRPVQDGPSTAPPGEASSSLLTTAAVGSAAEDKVSQLVRDTVAALSKCLTGLSLADQAVAVSTIIRKIDEHKQEQKLDPVSPDIGGTQNRRSQVFFRAKRKNAALSLLNDSSSTSGAMSGNTNSLSSTATQVSAAMSIESTSTPVVSSLSS